MALLPLGRANPFLVMPLSRRRIRGDEYKQAVIRGPREEKDSQQCFRRIKSSITGYLSGQYVAAARFLALKPSSKPDLGPGYPNDVRETVP